MTVGHILATKGRDVITIETHCSVAEAAELLARKGIGVVVIVDSAGAVAGIFSERDIVRLLAAKGAAALQDQVANWMTRSVMTASDLQVRDKIYKESSDKWHVYKAFLKKFESAFNKSYEKNH